MNQIKSKNPSKMCVLHGHTVDSAMKPLSDKNFFRVPSICSRLIGIWPLDTSTKICGFTWKSVYRAYILTSILALCGSVQTRYLLQDVHEVTEVLDALFLTVTIIMGVFKILVTLISRKNLKEMLLTFYDLYKNGNGKVVIVGAVYRNSFIL